jgi:pyruvate formate lyase activating enzyme
VIANGLHGVYVDTIQDPVGAGTSCSGCAARLIERDWYTCGEWRLNDVGQCLVCGTPIPGVFNGAPGT